MAEFNLQSLSQMDKSRLSDYKANLDFYDGSQWTEKSKNRQLVFNYARISIDKVTSYMMKGINFACEPLPAGRRIEAEADALAAAGAVQSRQRLNMVHGFISSPPNCGAELYDVIRIEDRGSPFQGGINYRIAGIVNTYEASSGNFVQHLELCAI